MEHIKTLESRIIEQAESELKHRIGQAVNQLRYMAGDKVSESIDGATLNQQLELVTTQLFNLLVEPTVNSALDEALAIVAEHAMRSRVQMPGMPPAPTQPRY